MNNESLIKMFKNSMDTANLLSRYLTDPYLRDLNMQIADVINNSPASYMITDDGLMPIYPDSTKALIKQIENQRGNYILTCYPELIQNIKS